MGSFLEQYNDPGLEVDMGWDPEQYATEQRDRLLSSAALGHFALLVPRRLGGDATAQELRRDKQLSRRVESRHLSVYRLWDTPDLQQYADFVHENQEELKINGAQVDWLSWWDDRKAWLRSQLRVVATTALKTGHIKLGNRYGNRLINELAQLNQVFELFGPNR